MSSGGSTQNNISFHAGSMLIRLKPFRVLAAQHDRDTRSGMIMQWLVVGINELMEINVKARPIPA
jgi:hypothetical protein